MFNYIETYTIITRNFIYQNPFKRFIETSFIEPGLSGCIVSHCWKQSSNFIVGVSIFSASFGQIFVKSLLKFSAIRVSSVIVILSTITFLGKF